MSNIIKVLSGIGVLIAIYLFLSNGSQTVKIINSLGGNLADMTQILQGRNKLITD